MRQLKTKIALAIFSAFPICCLQAQDAPPVATPKKVEQPQEAKKANPDNQPMVQAKAFLSSLTAEQKAKAVMPFDSEKRVNWHFIPMATRKGLPLMEMKPEQQAAALKLLKACLSPAGYEKAEKIMELEKLLKTIEGEKGQNERNPVKYYYTLFGEPARKQRWGLSIEGHHLSLNFVFEGNQVLDSTPQFFASNPAVVKSDYEGFPKGLSPLKPEEQQAFNLMKSLNKEQQQKATLAGDTPTEIRAAGEPQPPTAPAQGIAVSDLDDIQKEALKKLLTVYTSKMKQLVAKRRWEMIDEAGWDKVRFAWSGGTSEGQKHYYVVQGPTFLVEFINVQPDAAGNPANHIHCVWRDMSGDFDLPIK
jgi:Protein of unknown function (DUF3500)